MDLITEQQSALLQRISGEPLYYSDLSDEEQAIATYLISLNYVTATKKTDSRHGNSYVSLKVVYNLLTISETGKAYLVNEKLFKDKYQFLEQQIHALRDLADTAISDSDSARKDALFSKVVSIIAVIISIIAIIVPQLS